MTTDFVFKLKPFEHQMRAWLQSRDLPVFALLMEQGTGKTKVGYDTTAWLYANGRINALLVVAPNGVHRNWTEREAPTHIPDYIDWMAAYYVSPSSITVKERKALQALWEFKGLRILSMNVEAFSHSAPFEYAKKFLNAHNALMIVDESSTIKTPGAKRTKNLIVAGRRAKYRRILTGTPYTQAPLDIFSQFKFLTPQILGNSFVAFRAEYATTVQRENKAASARRRRPVFYEEVTGYKNLDELKRLVAEHAFRVRKVDCLDLPPKLYERRPVPLTPDQSRLYKQMLDESRAFLSNIEFKVGTDLNDWFDMSPEDQLLWVMENKDKVETMTASNAAVKLTRLQQIVGGYFDGEAISKINPRLNSLIQLCEECAGKIIIWARFRDELSAISRALSEAFGEGCVAEYHGGIKPAEREAGVDGFCNGDTVRFFVSQQHAGGYGLTLVAASDVVYYSNDFSLEARLQSEDRAHRIGQEKHVTYYDMVAPGTVDEKVLSSLELKREMADRMTGDSDGDSVHSPRATAQHG